MQVDWEQGSCKRHEIKENNRRKCWATKTDKNETFSVMINSKWRVADVSEEEERLYVTSMATSEYWAHLLQLKESEHSMTLRQHQRNKFRESVSWAHQFTFSELTDENIEAFINQLVTTGVDAVSDGTAKDGEGAASWIIIHMEGSLAGGFKVPGDAKDQDSFRNEMEGLLGIISVVRAAVQCFHLKKVALTVPCDGEGALKRSFQNERPSSMTDSHWDFVAQLQMLVGEMPYLNLEWRHVAGHQDNDPHEELDIWARWNILMDVRAKACREAPGKPTEFPRTSRLWSVRSGDEMVVRQALI